MGIIVTILTFLWNHRRAVVSWSLVVGGALAVAWLSTKLLTDFGSYVSGWFSGFVDQFTSFMDGGKSYLDGWVASTDVEWIDTIYRLTQVSYFVQAFIGFIGLALATVGASITSLGVVILGQVLRYIWIVYKARRAAQIARLNSGNAW